MSSTTIITPTIETKCITTLAEYRQHLSTIQLKSDNDDYNDEKWLTYMNETIEKLKLTYPKDKFYLNKDNRTLKTKHRTVDGECKGHHAIKLGSNNMAQILFFVCNLEEITEAHAAYFYLRHTLPKGNSTIVYYKNKISDEVFSETHKRLGGINDCVKFVHMPVQSK